MRRRDRADALPRRSAGEVLLHSRRSRGACALLHALPCGLSQGPHAGLHQPGTGPQGRRFPHSAIPHRRWYRRHLRPRPDGRRAEALLSARAAYRLHLRQHLRGAWPYRRARHHRALRAAVLSTDPFARFLAFGITSAILIQAFFNISVVLAIVPTKGITLPLISSGGTSVFITLASLGVLLNITREID